MLKVSIKRYFIGFIPYWQHFKCLEWLIVCQVKQGNDLIPIVPSISLKLSEDSFHIIGAIETKEFKVQTYNGGKNADQSNGHV